MKGSNYIPERSSRTHTGITAPSPNQCPVPHHRSHGPQRGKGAAQQWHGDLRRSDRSEMQGRTDSTCSGSQSTENGGTCQMKGALDGINNRLHDTDEKMRKLEETKTNPEWNRKKTKIPNNVNELWDFKGLNAQVSRVLRGEVKTENFPNLMETINPQTLASHQLPSTRNMKKTTPRHTTKLFKVMQRK